MSYQQSYIYQLSQNGQLILYIVDYSQPKIALVASEQLGRSNTSNFKNLGGTWNPNAIIGGQKQPSWAFPKNKQRDLLLLLVSLGAAGGNPDINTLIESLPVIPPSPSVLPSMAQLTLNPQPTTAFQPQVTLQTSAPLPIPGVTSYVQPQPTPRVIPRPTLPLPITGWDVQILKMNCELKTAIDNGAKRFVINISDDKLEWSAE